MANHERSDAALEDWREIVEYTMDRYGEKQTEKYMDGLLDCINAMAEGSGYFRDNKVKNRTIRIKHCQKHYIFGLVRKNSPIMIIAIFHEQMDLMDRLKNRLR